MNFVPSSTIFWVIPSSWWTIGFFAMVALIILFWMNSKLEVKPPLLTATGLTFGALIVGTGFNQADIDWLAKVWAVTSALGVVGVVACIAGWMNQGSNTIIRWSYLATSAVALLSALVLAACAAPVQPAATAKSVAAEKASLAAKLETELRDQKAKTAKAVEVYKQECKAHPGSCAMPGGKEQSDAEILSILISRGLAATAPDLDPKAVAKVLAESLAQMGWLSTEVKVGGKVDWEANSYDAGVYPASEGLALKSQALLADWLANTKAGQAVADELSDRTPDALHGRFLSGLGMVPVQFSSASCGNGTTLYKEGTLKPAKGKQCRQAGDVWWVPVAPTGAVYWAAAIRVDSGNPHVDYAPFPTHNKNGKPVR